MVNAHQRSDITEKIGAVCRILFSILQIIVVAAAEHDAFAELEDADVSFENQA